MRQPIGAKPRASETLRLLGAAFLLCVVAGEALALDKAQADAAAAFIRRQKQVVLYCAEPDCEDKSTRLLDVKRVELLRQGARQQILLNGAPVDPASIYFLENGNWYNLAIRLNLLVAGVPEQLPVPPGGSSIDCAALARQAGQRERRIVPILRLGVIGQGRLHFYRAPDKGCRDDKVFVIPGDALTGYAEYEGWTWVMYVNPASGKEFHGWVPDGRVKGAGTMAPGK
jgi:hypothetical protein